MTYGHAERNLLAVRSLDRQTEHLLRELERTNPDRAASLRTLFADSAPGADTTTPVTGVLHGMVAETESARAGYSAAGSKVRLIEFMQ